MIIKKITTAIMTLVSLTVVSANANIVVTPGNTLLYLTRFGFQVP